MRPIRLKMSAFGAYVKPVEIDFEAGLGGENFFLIHGATGSGKTTILDAICFALYGESSGGSRKSSMMRSEQATPSDKTEVEFVFSLRGKTYRIRRNPKYQRAILRGGGLTEQKASADIYENGTRINTRDVSEYVRNLLKFDSEQFRQVVVLPQGAFQKFLLAKSDARQVILNMLFNAEFFKRVEDSLKLKAADARRTFEELTARKKNYLEEAACSETELPALIEKLSAEFDTAQTQIKMLEAQTLDAQKNYSDGKILSKAFGDLASKSQALTDAQELLEKISDEVSAAQIEFDKRQAEEPLRKELERRKDDLAKKKIALGKLQAKRDELDKAIDAAGKSSAKVKELESLKRRCDDTMTNLLSEEEKLRDAPAKKVSAEKTLNDAKASEELLQAIEDLRGKISSASKDLSAATKNHEAAEQKLSDLRQAQVDGSAARLAATLEEGKPCPVCGAIHHPAPAASTTQIPTDAQIKAAESKLKTLAEQKISVEKILARLNGELVTKEKTLSEAAQVVTVAEAQAALNKISAAVKELERCRTRIDNGKVKIQKTVEELEAAQSADKKNSGTADKLRGEVSAMEREVDEKYSSDKNLLEAEISSTTLRLDELNAAFKQAQDKLNQQNNRAAAQKSTVEAAQKNKAEIAAQVEGKTIPDIPALKKFLEDTQADWQAAVKAQAELSARLERLNKIASDILVTSEKLKVADKNFLMWKTLSDAANGNTSKVSFQRYYLATMFKEVIYEANERLEKMSNGRYRFQNKGTVTDRRYSGGLDLEIVDDYTGTARPVETLSGGESFLASLSLALGLAAVVQNNAGGIKLDTIFIDEGFGTLDTETLDFAMKTLLELQSGGRLVGIISHVEELQNQLPVRLEIIKTKTGSSAKFIS